MKRSVIWSRDALDELIGIARHIAKDNPDAARKVAAVIRATGAALGQRALGRKGRVSGTYEKVVADLPYIIAYTFITRPTGGEALVILRIVHMARDWSPETWPSN
ncbi:type II toxin-antitoxin system RelE/ParE family toxin [Nitrospirillum pindoramense]|uniref:Plasmid stabilization system protein ParE n=1 Tax=Nitrospirillum amazonense TaxID=28077 RepID=A0A560HAH6_9PROT|nr:type II toxin-antitoxin system RelE/ParE family toxin [Nitrospirillum amazonense]TWB43355.1 plasmid stabilization system protein ParE [Nitrospirillum amazonense]